MSPLISIIIPHYARPELLAEAVKSVRSSTEQNFEIIIVDDGSSVEDWHEAQHLTDLKTRMTQRTDGIKGPSRCRNIGLAEAKGKFVIFLDSDDWMSPWCLKGRIAAIQAHADMDMVVFPVLLFKDRPGDLDVLWNTLNGTRDDDERFAFSDPPWHTSSPIWRTDSLRKIGGFNEALFYGDDSDLHFRAIVEGLNVRKETEALPDMFVRRSETPRITNSLSPFLIESRLMRLREGSRFLKSKPDCARLMDIWEGQYFVESEFLLFNHEPSREAVRLVLKYWHADCQPSFCSRWVVSFYFAVALAARKRAYLVLRLARRIAMFLLPNTYFPAAGSFHQAKAGHGVMERVRGMSHAHSQVQDGLSVSLT